mmetsp:Transcript_107943/g.344114  ORF Transcript_107943/g.344114 Transcript_107943/m.344114 type:complete len:253 (-) Transcript_107943:397-1155(-)
MSRAPVRHAAPAEPRAGGVREALGAGAPAARLPGLRPPAGRGLECRGVGPHAAAAGGAAGCPRCEHRPRCVPRAPDFGAVPAAAPAGAGARCQRPRGRAVAGSAIRRGGLGELRPRCRRGRKAQCRAEPAHGADPAGATHAVCFGGRVQLQLPPGVAGLRAGPRAEGPPLRELEARASVSQAAPPRVPRLPGSGPRRLRGSAPAFLRPVCPRQGTLHEAIRVCARVLRPLQRIPGHAEVAAEDPGGRCLLRS